MLVDMLVDALANCHRSVNKHIDRLLQWEYKSCFGLHPRLHAGYLSADMQLTVNRCIDQLLLSEYMSCIDRRTGYTLVTCWQQCRCFASVVNASVDALVVSQLACWLTQQCFFAGVHDLLVTCWPMRWLMRWWDQIHYDTWKGTKWNLRKLDPPSLHQPSLGMEGEKDWSRKCWGNGK